MIQMTNTSTGDIVKTKVIDNPPVDKIREISYKWLSSFFRGVSIPIDSGLWELRITYADVTLTQTNKQLQIF